MNSLPTWLNLMTFSLGNLLYQFNSQAPNHKAPKVEEKFLLPCTVAREDIQNWALRLCLNLWRLAQARGNLTKLKINNSFYYRTNHFFYRWQSVSDMKTSTNKAQGKKIKAQNSDFFSLDEQNFILKIYFSNNEIPKALQYTQERRYLH